MASFRKSFKMKGEEGSNGGEEYVVEDLKERMYSSRGSRFNLIESELEVDSTQGRFSRQAVINGFRDVSQRWIIHPDNRWYKAWEKFILVWAIYSSFFTPLEFGFFRGLQKNLFILDIAGQVAFLVDIVLQFFVAYRDSHSYKMVYKRSPIALRFLRSHFFPDLLACMPWDIIYKVCGEHEGVRYLLWIRLTRVRKVIEFFQRMEKDIRINYLFTRIMKLIAVELYCTHTAACIFYYLATTLPEEKEGYTWIGSLKLGDYSYSHFRELDIWKRYTTSLYFAIVTMSTVGYGDIHAVNLREMIFVMIYVSFDMILGAYLIGNMTALIVKGSNTVRYRDKMTDLTKYMNRNRLGRDLRNQIKGHLRLQYESSFTDAGVLQDIPMSIRAKISQTLYKSYVENVRLFKDCSPEFINQIVTRVNEEFFLPGEVIMEQGNVVDQLYFVCHGILEEVGIGADGIEETVSLLEPNNLFGEISILCNIPQPYTVRVCELYRLLRIDKQSFTNILEIYFHDGRKVLTNLLELFQDIVDAMVDFEDNVGDGEQGTALIVVDNLDASKSREGVVSSSSRRDVGIEGDSFEPHDGIEFDSHEAAYSFYQEYAKSMGFTTSIKNSRRSKKTKEFIDAKFACSRYGVTPESESGVSRRPSVKKTDCKASMHVKKRRDGKWYIHEFIKEHNHELFPALAYHFRIHRNVKLAEKNNIDILHAVSERTRKMYVEMLRQASTSQSCSLSKNEFDHQFDRGRYLALEEGDAQFILEYFVQIQKETPCFFYAVDLNEDQRVRNLFWVDAKSRKDYVSFNDVVFFDTSYTKSSEKMPIALFLGVNHHFQPMLLGCALLADETKLTYVWLMKTWLRAMGGQSPKAIISDQDKQLKSAIEEVMPFSRHCFALWHILEKIPETLGHVLKQHENFMKKFNKYIFKSLTDEEFDMRWWKMVSTFELQENEWIHSIYADRKKWIPTFMRDAFLAGMSPHQRSESVNSFFDKYIHKKINLKEFVRQYGSIVKNRYEEEDMADFDTWHKQPALKSPSPWEKQMSTIYTHAIFRRFQVEVLGVVGCHPKKEKESGGYTTFRVDDCEKSENFVVTWKEATSEASCSCLMFEYKGFLCRHSMIVLQICGLSSIPSRYILKRWTKDAKSKQILVEGTERIQNRVQRYNDLCRRAIELGEEGSLSEENYNIACLALVEALKSCVNINNRNPVECSSNSVGIRYAEEENQTLQATKTNKKKNTNKKRKMQPEPEAVVLDTQNSLQQMDHLSSEGIPLNGYYGSQQHVHGLLNLMEPPNDAFYVGQQTMQGLGQLHSLASSHDSFYGAQQSMPALGHMDFRQPAFTYGMQDEQIVRPTQLHGSARHT